MRKRKSTVLRELTRTGPKRPRGPIGTWRRKKARKTTPAEGSGPGAESGRRRRRPSPAGSERDRDTDPQDLAERLTGARRTQRRKMAPGRFDANRIPRSWTPDLFLERSPGQSEDGGGFGAEARSVGDAERSALCMRPRRPRRPAAKAPKRRRSRTAISRTS